MGTPLAAANKDAFHLVEFRYGSPEVFRRYTNWDSNVSFGSGEFTATPSMEIEASANTGTIQDKAPRVILPTNDFTKWLSSGEPIGIVEFKIYEITLTETGQIARYRYDGRITSCARNYRGQEGISMIEGSTLAQDLSFALGVVASNQCTNVFAGPGCFKSLTGLTGTGTVAAIAEAVVTVTGLPTFSGMHWNRGFLRRNGVEVPIRSWLDTDPTRFVLTRQPPESWIGQSVFAVPGCLQTVEACRYWGNELQFVGLGFKMPAYNPLIEQPS